MPQYMQLRIELLDTDPPVWRRIAVDPRLTMEQLHTAIQHAMGWTNSHMHEFRTKKGKCISRPMAGDADFEREVIDERRITIAEVFPKPKTRLAYIYDMGDDWVHAVDFEKMIDPPPLPPLSKAKATPAAIFMDGKRACPPEDCGGIPGYYRILELKADPKSAAQDDADLLEWIGDWQPDSVPDAEAQQQMTKIRVKAAGRK